MASVYTVKQVNSYIKNMFSQDFALNHIFIKGEVSNCKYHSSGHIYFTLKDASGVISAVMFAGQRAAGLKFKMQEGQQVIAAGSVSVYERDGRYQLYAKSITLDGEGDLYQRFIKLRDQLEEMGMFAQEYKQPIPAYAKKVGIVTASTGAAVRDIMNIAYRRNPYVQLYLYPAQVQGDGAAASIAAGIALLDQMKLDVIIIGRGGGSIEDLWAFNEEITARAVFNCTTPVISAVGHETDVTICDYVADMRAPTPSAGAELAVFEYTSFAANLRAFREQLSAAAARRIRESRSRTELLQAKLVLYHPGYQLRTKRQYLIDLEDKLQAAIRQKVMLNRHRLELAAGRLDGLSPLKKLGSGYAYVTDGADQKLVTVKAVNPGDRIRIRLKDGTLQAKVTDREDL